MIWSDYWNALGSRQRLGVGIGAAAILAAVIAAAAWALHDPYAQLASGLSPERLNELAQEMERAQIDFRVSEGSDAIVVPASQLGKARAAAAGGEFGAPPSVGLELFKETDFSTTDFAQRINYQRALQGELTRTIQTIAGVRSARVHVILPESAVLRRNAGSASAAVTVALQPGVRLSPAQVRGIQRLVAASVPQIAVDDVVVLDDSGASLTRAVSKDEGDLSAAQLDLKRQADQYLEGKLSRLLEQLAPDGIASLSIDTTLDYRQLRVTTEEPIAARTPNEEGRAAGVLIKERQSQRSRATSSLHTADYAEEPVVGPDSTDREYEYKVGHRMEQTLSNPGSIKRVSVAVALQGAPPELTADAVERLVAHAVGIDRTRGDSVAIVLLPLARGTSLPLAVESAPGAVSANGADEQEQVAAGQARLTSQGSMLVLALALVLLAGAVYTTRSRRRARQPDSVDIEAVAAKVREWLHEGAGSDRT